MTNQDAPTGSAPIIDLRDVSFSYGADEGAPLALSHISLSVEPGGFLGIIGPSGAGKSTLTSVMSGAIPHHYGGRLYGAALVDGTDTCDVSLTDISRVVGSVLQDIDTQMVASVVEDEMLFGLENFGVPHDEIEGRIAETLETVGIPELRAREIATLSGGQKQKVAIAAILALRPRVLILDEPTAALDPASSVLVFDTLRAVNEQGVTVVVVEQKVALLSEYCGRIAVMDHGRLALTGTPHEVFAHGEELRAIGVDSPRVARISNSLAADGIVPAGQPCLNVDEAVAMIRRVVTPLGTGASWDAPAKASAAASAATATGSAAASTAGPVVTFRDVTFAYPGGGASVRHLDLTVLPGEVVGIVGQNGAGKTTLTKLLNGLLKPLEGHVTVAGLDTRDTPVSQIAAHVATLFQNPDHQICKDTVLDEVAFGLELHGVGAAEARERAMRVIERFHLPADEAPFTLSRGQRQMVALASVVVIEPEVVLLDEPTSGLDYRECMTVMETVAEMARQGCAVVMVCHDMEVVSDFAQRLAVMANGEILGRGDTSEIFADEDLMRRASVEAPQVARLSARLAREVSPAFAHISEVSGIVDTVKGMIAR